MGGCDMNSEISWVQEVNDAKGVIIDMSFALNSLASSFDATGNSKMADTLHEFGDVLLKQARIIGKSVGRSLSEDVQRGRTQIAEILVGTMKVSKGE